MTVKKKQALGARGGTPAAGSDAADRRRLASIDRVIKRHLAALRKPGVLTVRPGIESAGGRITGREAIVVTVDAKRRRVPKGARLPEEIEGIPVDVREATAAQRLRRVAPKQHAVLAATTPHVAAPYFPFERAVGTGKLVPPPRLPPPLGKPQIAYTPPRSPRLRSVSRRMTIVACASPDAGFTVLADFLSKVKERLTVGLYDFTSGDILTSLTASLQGGHKAFTLVLDHPAPNPTANQSDEQTVAALRKADGGMRQAWALTRGDPFAAKWIFPMAYHIKVAVRDSSSFWLSSGNWNVSNQPNLAAGEHDRGALDTADRDWHVIVMDPGLARLYQAYIEHDFSVASAVQRPKPDLRAKQAVVSAAKAHARLQRAPKAQPPAAAPSDHGPPFTLGKPTEFRNAQVRLQPLLTPDRGRHGTMYVDKVLALLQSAKRRLYMQTQYISQSKTGKSPPNFLRLVAAVGDAVRRKVDVRIILSQYENSESDVELLHTYGLSPFVRIQQRVHNKGIVVDSRAVMVSSQNWSAEGVLQNRDAGVIIHNAAIAKFFEQIFLQDWNERATDHISSSPHSSVVRILKALTPR